MKNHEKMSKNNVFGRWLVVVVVLMAAAGPSLVDAQGPFTFLSGQAACVGCHRWKPSCAWTPTTPATLVATLPATNVFGCAALCMVNTRCAFYTFTSPGSCSLLSDGLVTPTTPSSGSSCGWVPGRSLVQTTNNESPANSFTEAEATCSGCVRSAFDCDWSPAAAPAPPTTNYPFTTASSDKDCADQCFALQGCSYYTFYTVGPSLSGFCLRRSDTTALSSAPTSPFFVGTGSSCGWFAGRSAKLSPPVLAAAKNVSSTIDESEEQQQQNKVNVFLQQNRRPIFSPVPQE